MLAYLPPRTPRSALRRAGPAHPIRRRGILHGWVVETAAAESDPPDAAEVARRWRTDHPILLRGVLRPHLAGFRPAIARTRAAFDRFRDGLRFQDWIQRRLRAQPRFALAGATVDLGDPRELEKVFAHERHGRRTGARDLFAKLSWIAHDPQDVSLRIRFSHGHEALNEWWQEPRRSRASDRLAATLFPECAVLAERAGLARTVRRLTGHAVRFSERIVYNNAPGGGAVFHHDAEPTQEGVLFGQLQGATFWLALPRRQLAREVAMARRLPPRAAARALDDTTTPWLHRLLNETPALTARLVAGGHATLVRAGDALLLPSHSGRDTCWHSVFALGDEPSLALSFGIFARRPGRG